MLRYLIILLLPLTLFSQTEEKRLALVIGNSNYDKGPLNNPVNDALLIAETLKKLEFDVILDTNIENRSAFVDVVMEFGDKRPEYDVAFVYYAGHGVQVGAENYLLPTKVDFQKETDVRMKAMSVQDIMMYLTGMTNQVNILILDACRDNPFEGNWNATRSLKGSGLAKIPPPTGSLIAFSTDAGRTAADGKGKNSIYCESLCKNMLLENTSLDQVFRNVRADVLKKTYGNQRPVEASQLTGTAFYLVKSNYSKLFNEIFELIGEEKDNISQDYIKNRNISTKDAMQALEITSQIIALDSNNKRAYKLRGDVYQVLRQYNDGIDNYDNALKIDPSFVECYINKAYCYEELGQLSENKEVSKKNFEASLLNYKKALELDSTNYNTYNRRGILYGFYLEKIVEGIADLSKAIEINPEFHKAYINRATLYKDLEKYEDALADFITGMKIKPNESISHLNRGNLYIDLERYEEAIADFTRCLELSPRPGDEESAYSQRTEAYKYLEQYDNALKDINKLIELYPEKGEYYYRKALYLEWFLYGPIDANQFYNYKSTIIDNYNKAIELMPNKYFAYRDFGNFYNLFDEFDKSLHNFNKAIEVDSTSPAVYYYRANVFFDLKQYDNALHDYNKAIKLYKHIWGEDYYHAYIGRAKIYAKKLDLENTEKDFSLAISLDPKYATSYYDRGVCYTKLKQYDKAEEDFNTAISLYSDAPTFYFQRGLLFTEMKKYDKAEEDFNTAIALDPNSTEGYFYRSKYFIRINDLENAIIDCNKAITIDSKDPESYYNLGIIYQLQGKDLLSVIYITKSLTMLGMDARYYINKLDFSGKIELKDLYKTRGGFFQKMKEHELMCEDYQKSCDLGDCEMFNENCK